MEENLTPELEDLDKKIDVAQCALSRLQSKRNKLMANICSKLGHDNICKNVGFWVCKRCGHTLCTL